MSPSRSADRESFEHACMCAAWDSGAWALGGWMKWLSMDDGSVAQDCACALRFSGTRGRWFCRVAYLGWAPPAPGAGGWWTWWCGDGLGRAPRSNCPFRVHAHATAPSSSRMEERTSKALRRHCGADLRCTGRLCTCCFGHVCACVHTQAIYR